MQQQRLVSVDLSPQPPTKPKRFDYRNILLLVTSILAIRGLYVDPSKCWDFGSNDEITAKATTTNANDNHQRIGSNPQKWLDAQWKDKRYGCKSDDNDEVASMLKRQNTRVVVQQYMQTWTGGSEALVQLALAFSSWIPNHTFLHFARGYQDNRRVPCEFYPSFCNLTILLDDKTQQPSTDMLQAGDVYIIPEISRCPSDLVQRGVRVFVWQLGATNHRMVHRNQQAGCHYASHNFWLSHDLGVNVPPSHVLLPYLSPTKSYNQTIFNDNNNQLQRRQDLILTNAHDDVKSPEMVALHKYASANNHTNLTVVQVLGFTTAQLLDLYERAKIVVAFCMRGSERTPLEAVQRGLFYFVHTHTHVCVQKCFSFILSLSHTQTCLVFFLFSLSR